MSKGRSGDKWKTTRHDMYYKLAKEQGYRSRAAFKLIQLNKKFNFLSNCKAVLDCGAAPGGWLQVCQKFMPRNSLIVGVDLHPIRNIPDVISIQDDITTESCRLKLKKEFQGWQLDAVIHDGAPDVGGATWTKDAYMQNELVLHSLKLSTFFLREGGYFITKVFRSQDYNALLWVLKQFFKKCTVTKPAASRDASAEIFVVCEGYLAPKKIDPRLLDPESIFKQDAEAAKRADVFHDKPGKKNKAGYDEGVKMSMTKEATISDFLASEDAIDMLGTYNNFVWDEESKVYLSHSSTDNEIKHLVKDLKVLGKGDFSYLLKWRKKMVDYRAQLLKEQKGEEEEEEEEEEVEAETQEEREEREEAELDDELSELRESERKKLRKEKKRKLERINKERKKKALNENNISNVDINSELELFRLKGIKTKSALDVVAAVTDAELAASSSEDESEESEDDSDVDYLDKVEKDMDAAYEEYRKRRKIQSKKRVKVGLKDEEAPPESDDEEEQAADDGDEDEDEDENDNQHALSVSMGESKLSKKDVLARWFDRDLFAEDKEEQKSEGESTRPKKKHKGARAFEGGDGDSDSGSDSESDSMQKKPIKGKSKGAAAGVSVDSDDDDKKKNEEDDLEVVPMESDYSSDTDAQAEVLAVGQLMLRKRSKNDVVNGSYNRYSFQDKVLPEWFQHDEGLHNKPQLPVTKAQVAAEKAELKAINSRSIKRVAEAKARKKMKAIRAYEKAKDKAISTIENEDTSVGEKARAIQKMYQKKKPDTKKLPKTLMVSSSAGGAKKARRSAGKSGGEKRVDKRLKADTRGQKSAARKAKRGAKTKNKKKHRQ